MGVGRIQRDLCQREGAGNLNVESVYAVGEGVQPYEGGHDDDGQHDRVLRRGRPICVSEEA